MKIALISFDRPHYLGLVIDSIKKQTYTDYEMFLFQDGVINKYSWRPSADLKNINQCVDLFVKAFPDGHVLKSEYNIGIAENWKRAENLFFKEMKLEEAVFMEDDLELTSPYYLETLKNMFEEFKDDTDIGMFSAWGEVPKNGTPNVMKNMGHLWAFGTTRKNWEKRQRVFYDEYYNLVKGVDFIRRNREEIMKLYDKYGGAPTVADSQDGAICLASILADQIHISTEVNLATYIGEIGMHFTPQFYKFKGFDKTPVYKKKPISNFVVDKKKIREIQVKEFLK